MKSKLRIQIEIRFISIWVLLKFSFLYNYFFITSRSKIGGVKPLFLYYVEKKRETNFNKTFSFGSWRPNWAWSILWRRCNRWILSNFRFSFRFDNSSGFISMDLSFYFQNVSFTKRIWKCRRLNVKINTPTSCPTSLPYCCDSNFFDKQFSKISA